MKRLLTFWLLIFSPTATMAQLPTNGLAIQYDMVTTASGNLLDLSGNGNNSISLGSGNTLVAAGVSMGGSKGIQIPVVVKNNDVTVIIVKTGGGTGSAALWYEGNPNQSVYQRLTNNNSSTFAATANTGYFGPSPTIDWGNEYHAYYIQRAGPSGIAGVIDRSFYTGVASASSNSFNFSTDSCAAIGSQIFTTSTACDTMNGAFTGTVSYFLLYTRALTQPELRNAYVFLQSALTARGVYLADLPLLSSTSGRVWQRMGTVIKTGLANEPSVMYDQTGCTMVSSPCFKMWFSSTNTAISYAESIDALSWSVYGVVLGSLGSRCTVQKIGSNYVMYIPHSNDPNHQFDQLTSSDGINWSVAHVGVIATTPGTFDANGMTNPHVVYDGTSWYMAYEAYPNTMSGAIVGVATSTDGITWAKSPANPATGWAQTVIGKNGQGPFIWHSKSGKWYMWTGGAFNPVAGGSGGISRFETSTFNSFWQQSFQGFAFGDAVLNDEVGDGDPCFVEVNGKTYLFYGTGPAGGGNGSIKLAIANATMEQLVLTTEGALSSIP